MGEKVIWLYAVVWTLAATVLLLIVLSPFNLWNPLWMDSAKLQEIGRTGYRDRLWAMVIEAVQLTFLIAIPWGFLVLRRRSFWARTLMRYAVFLWTFLSVLYVAGLTGGMLWVGIGNDEYDRFRPAYSEPVMAEYFGVITLQVMHLCVFLVPAFIYWLIVQRESENGRV